MFLLLIAGVSAVLVKLILFLLLLAFIGWIVTKVPGEGTIKQIVVGCVIFLAVLVVILAVLALFGMGPGF